MANSLFLRKMPNRTFESCSAVKCFNWDLSPILYPECRTNLKYAVIILNRPISQKNDYIRDIWNNATGRMLVDGATLQWNSFLASLPEDMRREMMTPHFITGDFDSVTKDVLDEYEKQGCKVVHTLDQQYTDFSKSLMHLNNFSKEHNIEMNHVVAVAQTSGRLDHVLGNVQTMFLAKDKQLLSPNTDLYILSDDSLHWLLEPGDHIINVPKETWSHERAWCSLVPIGGTCRIASTTGLKWNLDKQQLKFGELVSTSNLFGGSEIVTIKCSDRILWSMRIPSVIDETFNGTD